MKIRNGFVSNSSTTSFCIYGAKIDSYDSIEDIEEKCYKYDLKCHETPYLSCVYIGKSWTQIEDDETGKQFKEKIESTLLKVFNIPQEKCGTYEEAWRDG